MHRPPPLRRKQDTMNQILSKVLKFRYFIALLVLAYVVLGGFVVWQLPVIAGHVVMMALAVASIVAARAFPARHKLRYPKETAKLQQQTEKGCQRVVSIMIAILVVHVIGLIFNPHAVFGCYLGEVITALLLVGYLLFFENDKEHPKVL